MEKNIGSISEGKKADIIIIDLNRTKSNPENNLISQIVYNTTGEDIDTTIINGRVLMENKRLKIDINKNELFKKCEEIILRISK